VSPLATRTISLTVNGQPHVAEVEPRRLLVDFLREDLGLPGTHIGCEHGVCGTCTVLLNGASIRSCITLAVQADGADISTVEGLARDGELHPLQDEFAAKQGLQCGYCTPGSRDGLPATGPGGSRTTVMLAGAVEGAAGKIKEKARRAAGHLLEIDQDDLEWADGGFRVRGDPERKKALGEIAIMLHLFKHSFPADMESGLDASQVFDHPYTTMPSADRKDLGVFYPFVGHACHVPVVEVDIETGAVSFLNYAAVHDCGTLVNPRSLAGHIVGGTAQGIGTSLYEEFVYDEDGQLLSSSFMDYLIPTAMEVPELAIGHVETPSPYTPHGIKGGGEGGRMMAPAAINAAVNDALAPLGVRLTELPMTPERILTALRAAGHEG
jgi:CO/xanthine dehydrogenase Mo-binding subunit